MEGADAAYFLNKVGTDMENITQELGKTVLLYDRKRSDYKRRY